MRLLIFLYPWLELLSLIQLGIETNAWVPLLWVAAMFLLGGALLRRIGVSSVNKLRAAQQQGILQQHLLVDDLAVAVAALLLIIPGLLSDTFALIVLIGPLRRWLARLLGLGAAREDETPGASPGEPQARRSVTLEGDFERVRDKDGD